MALHRERVAERRAERNVHRTDRPHRDTPAELRVRAAGIDASNCRAGCSSSTPAGTSGAQIGANGFDANGNFVARGLPRDANGDYPLARGTFFAPGAPRAFQVGARYTFGD
ncbi:MAG: hypothetical protein V4569_01670 [Pseudomonadota bacterium]